MGLYFAALPFVRFREGLRMPAREGGATRTGAGVRKPPREETAGGVARWRVRRYGDLTAVVPECEHNFCDIARTLRMGEMGENAFRRSCNFKELGVAKRAHIATFALCA
jgi:hypothetical protein